MDEKKQQNTNKCKKRKKKELVCLKYKDKKNSFHIQKKGRLTWPE